MKSVKNEQYHRLLKSHKWQRLRARYMAQHPVCEQCDKNGKTSLAKVVHHVVPVEDAKDLAMMEVLAFDWHNLMAVCDECHEAIHKQLGSCKKGRRQTRAEAQRVASAFIKRWCKGDDGAERGL